MKSNFMQDAVALKGVAMWLNEEAMRDSQVYLNLVNKYFMGEISVCI